MKAILLLEDGTLFRGIGFGAEGEAIGEVVFNTCMTGYQEILTDPSYYGQIVTMTYPQIGNYGVNEEDVESSKVHVSGFVVREYFDDYSNFRAKASISSYLKKNSVTGISEIDTRMLTKRIRLSGAMKGIISTETDDIKKLGDKLKNHPDMAGSDLVKYVTCKSSYIYKGDTAHNECNTSGAGPAYKIAVLDFGIKFNILRCLDDAGFKLHVMPAATTVKKILEFNPDGIFLSNGPGDPAAVGYAIKTISEILGRIPIFGICLGSSAYGYCAWSKNL